MPFPIINFLFGRYQPQRTRSVGRGRSKCPSYHPPTPYTLSPLPKGGEGRGEGGSYTHVPCPFGALLVTLYHFKSKAFLYHFLSDVFLNFVPLSPHKAK